jgi:hypothetical protein
MQEGKGLMTEKLIPVRFIDERIQVGFDKPVLLEKKPDCPDRFTLQEQVYTVEEKLGEWVDTTRRGRMARNMSDAHLTAASRRGSWGVGRFYFRVRTHSGQIFDLYYDRAPKNADDRKGAWYLYRELALP